MNSVRYFPLIVLLTIPAFVIKGMEGGDPRKALQAIGSQQLAKEASDVVCGADHPVLEETLVPRIRSIVFSIGNSPSSGQKAIDAMQRDALEVLMRKYHDSGLLNEKDKALVIRFVNYLLLVNIAQNEDRIKRLRQKINCQLPAVGLIGVIAGLFACKLVWGC